MTAHLVARAWLVAYSGAVTTVIKILHAAAEALISVLRRHVESPSDIAVHVAQLLISVEMEAVGIENGYLY